jgi:glucose-6-phosphate isomerase
MQLKYSESIRIENEQLVPISESLNPYVEHLHKVVEADNYNADESSINLPADENLFDEVMKLRNEKSTSSLKYFIDIGIGGSNLGTKAIYDALFGFFDNLEPERFPKIIFADTTNPATLQKITKLIQEEVKSSEEILINIISKSGGTTETTVNAEIIIKAAKEKFSDINSRVIVTSDEGSKLWLKAEELGFSKLALPKTVGGRFSVFSAVGLFPLACVGIDIAKLRSGALRVRQQCLAKELEENPALVSAAVLYIHSQNGKNINDNFFFNQELESLGKWYRQLMGESIGKEKDTKGNKVNSGITPTVSTGSTDLHSMAQLYIGGPKDKVTTFVYANTNNDISIPEDQLMPELVEGIQNKPVKQIMNAILEGTKIAYKNVEHPFMEILLDELNEYSLGEFLQFKMIEMMYLGKLLNVNTFDQPNVEDYKKETKKILLGE